MSTVPIDKRSSALSTILSRNQEEVLDEWLKEMNAATRRTDLKKDSDLRSECAVFLQLMKEAVETGDTNFHSSNWDKVREMLSDVSRSRAQQGFTPSETATFIFSAKRPLFHQLRQVVGNDANALMAEMWTATELLDAMGLYTT